MTTKNERVSYRAQGVVSRQKAAEDFENTVIDERLSEAVSAHDGKWPKELTSGVMFYNGLRITRAMFRREAR